MARNETIGVKVDRHRYDGRFPPVFELMNVNDTARIRDGSYGFHQKALSQESVVAHMEGGGKKICIIVPAHWEALMGGSQYQAKILIEHLVATQRYHIYYLARRVDTSYRPDGYKIVKVGDDRGFGRYGFFVDSPTLYRALREIRPDIIYQLVGCAYTGVSAFYARRFKCRMVWRITSDNSLLPRKSFFSRDLLPHRYLEKRMLEYGIANADAIVCQTEQQAALLERNYGRRPSAIVANFHPLPSETIRKDKTAKVVWIANFKKLKQPEIFVRLARDLQDIPNVQFVMIGAASGDRQWHESVLRGAKGVQNLSYIERQPQDSVNSLLARARVLVNTSQWEGFSNTFIQAWMRRVPVVSLNVDPDGVFGEERLGLCAGGSYEKLQDNVRRLIEDEALNDAIGKRAQAYAFEHFTERNVNRIMEILDSG